LAQANTEPVAANSTAVILPAPVVLVNIVAPLVVSRMRVIRSWQPVATNFLSTLAVMRVTVYGWVVLHTSSPVAVLRSCAVLSTATARDSPQSRRR
jgi:hypothetical protein